MRFSPVASPTARLCSDHSGLANSSQYRAEEYQHDNKHTLIGTDILSYSHKQNVAALSFYAPNSYARVPAQSSLKTSLNVAPSVGLGLV